MQWLSLSPCSALSARAFLGQLEISAFHRFLGLPLRNVCGWIQRVFWACLRAMSAAGYSGSSGLASAPCLRLDTAGLLGLPPRHVCGWIQRVFWACLRAMCAAGYSGSSGLASAPCLRLDTAGLLGLPLRHVCSWIQRVFWACLCAMSAAGYSGSSGLASAPCLRLDTAGLLLSMSTCWLHPHIIVITSPIGFFSH